MRSKVVLVRGWGRVAEQITLGEFERINADYVVLITALRYPSTLPEEYSGFEADPTSMYTDAKSILHYWALHDQHYMVAAEYANIVTSRSGKEIKAVEGNSLEIDWWYDTVRNYHRHFGQTVIDARVLYDEGKCLIIDGIKHSLEHGIELLRPQPFLG